jgi:deazaflavin-dependent oxidoreductase (nitroreductase family)
MSKRPGPVLRWALRAPRALYRRHLGWLHGRRFLLLEHVGRTSGRPYQTVLEVIGYDRSTGQAFVMSGWGRTSDWYRNIDVAGHAKITVGRHTTIVEAQILDSGDAAERLADYEHRNRWMRPILRHVLSRLAGFSYDGSDQSRQALVQTLPVIKLTPSPTAKHS